MRDTTVWAAAATLLALLLIGLTLVGEPDLSAAPNTHPPGEVQPVTDATTALSTTTPHSVVAPQVASVTTPAERSKPFQLTEPEPIPPPVGVAGDCDSWAPVFQSYGATPDEVAFFVPRIIRRETGCGRDTLNERSGDTGLCQINPTHNRAGYFGGRYFGDGGWLASLHGLRTRHDVDNPEWVNACLTLFRVCGSGPWQPPYSCANRRLP